MTHAAVGLATLLLATAPPSAPTPPGDGEITVVGKLLRDAPHLVERFSHATSGDRLGRWREPICVSVGGLSKDHDDWISARIRDVAEEIGAPVEDGGCDPNLIVIVASDDVALRADIVRHHDAYLNVGSRWPIDKVQLSAFAKLDGAPAHIFYTTGSAPALAGGLLHAGSSDTAQFGFGALLGSPIVKGQASRLTPMVETNFARIFLVLDGKQLAGHTLQQIAAYAAMVTLAEVRIDTPLRDPQTIVAMFADTRDGQPAPADLTLWDRSYLRALYGSGAQVNLTMQRSVIADELKAVVRATQESH